MALPAAAMPIIWVAVGGRKDLTATLIGTFFVLWLFQSLIVISQQYALIVTGVLLLLTILFAPGGYIVWLVENRDRIAFWRRGQSSAETVADAVDQGAAQ